MRGGPTVSVSSVPDPAGYGAPMTDDELLAAACPIIGSAGSSFYFTPETIARGESVGLDRGAFYFLGRGGVLGDVDAAVVSAAFGFFNPAVVARVWNGATQKMSPRAAGSLFMECCAEHGRRRLAGVAGLEAFNAACEKVLAAADGDSLPLFAAVNAEPRVDDAPGRAMQLVAVLREFRGSAHLLALRAVAVTSRDAHLAHRPDMARSFGWAEGQTPELDATELHTRLEAAERLTDDLVRPAFAALDQQERAAFVATLQAIAAALA